MTNCRESSVSLGRSSTWWQPSGPQRTTEGSANASATATQARIGRARWRMDAKSAYRFARMPPENSFARRALPPLCAFLAARALLVAAAAAAGFAPFGAALWKRWDSNLYLSIARDGYELVECSKIGYAPTGWCGNAGWMPG